MSTTVHDFGRWGTMSTWECPWPAMDPEALAIANIPAGTNPAQPPWRSPFLGPTLAVDGEGAIAVAGADLGFCASTGLPRPLDLPAGWAGRRDLLLRPERARMPRRAGGFRRDRRPGCHGQPQYLRTGRNRRFLRPRPEGLQRHGRLRELPALEENTRLFLPGNPSTAARPGGPHTGWPWDPRRTPFTEEGLVPVRPTTITNQY